MKCQSRFLEKIRKNIINLSSAELAQSAVKFKALSKIVADNILNF